MNVTLNTVEIVPNCWAEIFDSLYVVYDNFIECLLLAGLATFNILIVYCIFGGVTYTFVDKTPLFVEKKRVLFVTAHPDDECMFFGPTVIRLKKTCEIYLLCLSVGDHYGRGVERKRELWSSCEVLGIPAQNIMLMNNTRMPDDPDWLWNTILTSRILLDHIERLVFNEVYTFDIRGVSGHLNHISIFYAFARMCLRHEIPSFCKIYLLDSVNKLRKYSFCVDAAISCSPFSKYLFLISPEETLTLMEAMKKHHSQMAWFRILYMIFSRYMFMNTYKELELDDVQLVLQMDNREHYNISL